eukprot:TRINITY_DN596_c0_g2_i1.p1 TRINITY_DN596_c0_g2~~TRINITY_DN596_c0_g2_i1.p1  ORF type:complete len:378 (-),score=117.67 TRINITY_DN596_c0_g2_i1:352-1401(-)
MKDSSSGKKKKKKKLSNSNNNSSGNIIALNVGGKLFYTTKSTLLNQSFENTFFHSLLSEKFDSTKDKNGAYFIDRDGDIFEHILYFLRTGNLPIKYIYIQPENTFTNNNNNNNNEEKKEEINFIINQLNIEELMIEAEFYGLENLSNKLQEILLPFEVKNFNNKYSFSMFCKQHSEPKSDGYYKGLLPSNKECCLAFRPKRKGVILTHGTGAQENIQIFWLSRHLSTMWRDTDDIADGYARFCEKHYTRGIYYTDNGNQDKNNIDSKTTFRDIKLKFQNSYSIPGSIVDKGNIILLAHPLSTESKPWYNHPFIKFEYTPFPVDPYDEYNVNFKNREDIAEEEEEEEEQQ